MFRTIFASVWTLATIAVWSLGFSGSIDPVAMVICSLVALVLFYAFAVFTVIINTGELESTRVNG